MNKIRTTVIAMGAFFALSIAQGFAADQKTVGRTINNQLNFGANKAGGVTAPKPPVLVDPVPYNCNKKDCECYSTGDCGRMGQAGVCKAGTYSSILGGDGGRCERATN